MAIAFVQSQSGTTAAAASYTIVPAANVTAGNLIVVAGYSNGGTKHTTCTDNLGNSYINLLLNISGNGDAFVLSLWYAKNITGGTATITLGLSASASGQAVAREYSGADLVSPIDALKITGVTSLTPTGSSAATNNSNEMVVAICGVSGTTGTFALGSGYSNYQQAQSSVTIQSEDKLVTTPKNNEWATFTNSISRADTVAVFGISPTYVIPHTALIINNYQFTRVGDGMSASEKIR
jgi:hypothetical protein